MLTFWTIGRASGIGVSAGLAALLLWPAYARWEGGLVWPFLAALLVAGLCGVSILLITVLDLVFHRRRGERLRPVRAFDIALGLLLAGLALLALETLSGQLPA